MAIPDTIIRDPFFPTYLEFLRKNRIVSSINNCSSTDVLFQDRNTKKYIRELTLNLLPISKFSLILTSESASEQEADSSINYNYFSDIRNNLFKILAQLTNLKLIKDIRIDKTVNSVHFSNSAFYYSSANYGDKLMSFTVGETKNIQFFIENMDKHNTFIGCINYYVNNDCFVKCIDTYLSNLGEKQVKHWKF